MPFETESAYPDMDKVLFRRYMTLPQPDDMIQATYIWIDGSGQDIRCKTRTINKLPSKPSDLPIWNYDGSSTSQSLGKNSDLYLKPVAIFRDPFLLNQNILVLCDVYDHEGFPHQTNKRYTCQQVIDRVADESPFFAIAQEFTFLSPDHHPLGWPKNGFPGPQGPYFCGVGAGTVYGRPILESHYRACEYAGVSVFGEMADVMPSQWSYQVGPLPDIKMADHLWISRYILKRVSEDFSVKVSFDPKPQPRDWNDAGCVLTFSSASMRSENGQSVVEDACILLERNHMAHMKAYDPEGGRDNWRRLTDLHETSKFKNFSYGNNRGASVRIPSQSKMSLLVEGDVGFIEDTRPSSNCDPYAVIEVICRTVLLGERLKEAPRKSIFEL